MYIGAIINCIQHLIVNSTFIPSNDGIIGCLIVSGAFKKKEKISE